MSRSKLFDLAREIRNPGEKWNEAVKRASSILKEQGSNKKSPKTKESILKEMKSEKAYSRKQDFRVKPKGENFELIGIVEGLKYSQTFSKREKATELLEILNS